jgi:hypothetical protein
MANSWISVFEEGMAAIATALEEMDTLTALLDK